MFVSGHILAISDCGKYAAIQIKHHVGGQPRSCMTTPSSKAAATALREAARSMNYSVGEDDEAIVGVSVDTYKKLHPHWFVTEDELMKMYQLAQRDQKVDIHPELLPHAKRIWSERLKVLINATMLVDDSKKLKVVCESSAAHDHEGIPV